jgi:uncharacterized membrane protein HdeD (DUF308 family)
LGILGFLAILFGITLIANPKIAAMYIPYLLGIFAVIGGIGAIIGTIVTRSNS